MTLAGTPLQVAFPCRPSAMARDLTLVNTPLRWTLSACDAQGMTFGVAWADLPGPDRTSLVLQALARQSGENLRARVLGAQPASVPGMTPHPGAQWIHLAGQAPGGSGMSQQVLLFVHGLRVYQASVLGPSVDAAAAQAFFDALRVQP